MFQSAMSSASAAEAAPRDAIQVRVGPIAMGIATHTYALHVEPIERHIIPLFPFLSFFLSLYLITLVSCTLARPQFYSNRSFFST